MHLGLIGGIGPAATELYYRGLVARHAGATSPLRLTIAHADQDELVRTMEAGDAAGQALRFLRHVDDLAAGGAEIVALASVAAHFCVADLRVRSRLPILDIRPAVNAAVASRSFRRIGLLGTRIAMTTRLYGGLDAAVLTPPDRDIDRLHEHYVAMARSGHATDQQRGVFLEAGRRLVAEQGAEAVLLGGTDLFLAFAGSSCDYPVLDCAEIHIDALHDAAKADAYRDA